MAIKYVDNSGSPACSDTPGNGSEANPWCTIAYSITQISGSDTVNVKTGTYAESFTISGVDGTSGNPTIFQAFLGDTPTINNGGGGRVKILDSAWITFAGFIVTEMNQGIFVQASNNIVIQNNTVHTIEQEGVRVKATLAGTISFNVLIDNNTIHTTGTNEFNGEGVYIGSAGGENDQSHDITVSNNLIHDTDDEGIELKPSCYNCIVEDNTLFNCVTGSSTVGSIEVNQEEDRGINPAHIIRNNFISDSDTAIRAGTGCQVYNNVIWGLTAGHFGIYVDNLEADGYTRVLYHNTINESTGDAINVAAGSVDSQNNIGPATAGNNIAFNSADFVNVAADNYRLLGGSGPRNIGADLTATTPTDILGASRPLFNGNPDAGAYQYIPVTQVAASCSSANVQTAINAAFDGDTVSIPSGSCTWSSLVTADNKGLRIVGAGIDVTTITLGQTSTILSSDLDAGNSTFTISAITWDANDVDTGGSNIISLNGGGLNAFRLHDMKFINLLGTAVSHNMDGNEVSGLIDNCTFVMPTSSGSKSIRLFGADSGEHTPFSRAFELGSEKFIFIEDCTFTFDNKNDGALDSFSGARYVFRYNVVTNTNVEHHGADSGGFRGIHSFEIYNNTFDKQSAGNIRAGYFRSGSGVVHDNTWTGNYSVDSLDLTIFRVDESHAPWGQCNGLSIWDENAGPPSGYACLDQPGHIFTDSSGGSNTIEGVYAWNNGGMDWGINGHSAGAYLTEDVEYFNDTVKSGYTPFTYPHPLQGLGNGNGGNGAAAQFRGVHYGTQPY